MSFFPTFYPQSTAISRKSITSYIIPSPVASCFQPLPRFRPDPLFHPLSNPSLHRVISLFPSSHSLFPSFDHPPSLSSHPSAESSLPHFPLLPSRVLLPSSLRLWQSLRAEDDEFSVLQSGEDVAVVVCDGDAGDGDVEWDRCHRPQPATMTRHTVTWDAEKTASLSPTGGLGDSGIGRGGSVLYEKTFDQPLFSSPVAITWARFYHVRDRASSFAVIIGMKRCTVLI